MGGSNYSTDLFRKLYWVFRKPKRLTLISLRNLEALNRSHKQSNDGRTYSPKNLGIDKYAQHKNKCIRIVNLFAKNIIAWVIVKSLQWWRVIANQRRTNVFEMEPFIVLIRMIDKSNGVEWSGMKYIVGIIHGQDKMFERSRLMEPSRRQ